MLSRALLFTPPGFWLALGRGSAKLDTFESSITSLLVLADVAASAETPDSNNLTSASCHATAGTTLNYFLDRGLNKVCHWVMRMHLMFDSSQATKHVTMLPHSYHVFAAIASYVSSIPQLSQSLAADYTA